MTLIEVVSSLHLFDDESTIYALKPWTSESISLVMPEEEFTKRTTNAELKDYAYFLEVFVAIEVLEDWILEFAITPDTKTKAERLIQYAINDA